MELTELIQVIGAVSVLNTLTVEAAKKLLEKTGVTFHGTILAAITAVILSLATSILYVVYTACPVTAQLIVKIIIIVYMSFLCSTVTFDKVKEALNSIGRN